MRLKWIFITLFVSITLTACTLTVVAPSSHPAEFDPQALPSATATTVSILNSSVPTRESCGCTPKPALTLVGLVEKEEVWNLVDLRSMGFEKVNIHFPKEGNLLLETIHLNKLLDLAGPTEKATSLRIISGDGTTADVDLKALRACSDCLIALYGEQTSLRMVMPGFPDTAWVKAVKKLEVK